MFLIHLYIVVVDVVVFLLDAVFVVDTGKACFIWVGSKASVDERRKSFQYAHVSILFIY